MSNKINKTESKDKGVFIIYTGGTIGCVPSDPSDSESPLVVATWDEFSKKVPTLDLLKKDYPIDTHSFKKPIDSTNMKPEYWKEMVEVIDKNYDKYNGFVILHGTDTMVYTAAALSFMLENLEKPVIITGSQLPIVGNPRNDGEQNLMTSIMIANGKFYRQPVVTEVCIFFRDKLIRGNRAKKVSANGYAGFDSPNYPCLGIAGEHIEINKTLLRKPTGRKLIPRKRLNTNVINFSIFPGVQDGRLLGEIINLPDLKAIVLPCYGTGNAPTEESFLDKIETSTKKGHIVLDVSQCIEGAVELGIYETSVALLDRGVVGASDITPEAAMCKLMVLLGNEDLETEDINRLVQQNIAGEQSISVVETKYRQETVTLNAEKNRYRIPGEPIPAGWKDNNLNKVLLRLRNVELQTSSDEKTPINISIFVDISSDDPLDKSKPGYAGTFKRISNQVSSTLIFDITDAARKVVAPGGRLSLTIAIDDNPNNSLKWKQVDLVLHLSDWYATI